VSCTVAIGPPSWPIASLRSHPRSSGLFSIVAETFSHPLTEAWALGIPVVATDLGAFGERCARTRAAG